jgi:hypothetical protein
MGFNINTGHRGLYGDTFGYALAIQGIAIFGSIVGDRTGAQFSQEED